MKGKNELERYLVNSLQDVLSPGDKCICVFIQQEGFQKKLVLNEGGISKCGIWKLDQINMLWVNKVVVYYRHHGINEIITGDYEGISPTIFCDHYSINFRKINIDQTLKSWNDFCGGDSNNIKFYP
jgi:hypothetical protein